MNAVRLPLEERLRLLGLDKPLAPGERSVAIRLRLPASCVDQVLTMTAEERGRVFMVGLEVMHRAEADQ